MIFMNKKALILSVFLYSIFFSCSENKDAEKEVKTNYSGKPKVEFYKTLHNFGNLKEGEIVECTFKFKNIGTAPLKLTYVDADCGCTTPQYSKDEILPGKEGKIKAVFNSEGFRNNIYKTIDVETNSDTTITELVITAFVESHFKLD